MSGVIDIREGEVVRCNYGIMYGGLFTRYREQRIYVSAFRSKPHYPDGRQSNHKNKVHNDENNLKKRNKK